MLTLRLTPYASATWSWTGASYVTAEETSSVTPYSHPMVEQLAVTDQTRTLLIVRERLASRASATPELRTLTPAAYDQAVEAAERWPADIVMIETESDRPVRITAGAARTTPLYLAHQGGTLHGSWDMASLKSYATGINPREAARLLIYRPRYGCETLFSGITRLTERATAIFGGALHLHYPEPALHSAPRELAPDGDVLAALTESIDLALDLRPLEPAITVFHLTGGFDSGVIATHAAQRWPSQLTTAALLVIGTGREQQARRRTQIRDHLPFGQHDLLIDCAKAAPLHPDCPRVRGELISPYEEPLFLPFSRLASLIADHGAQTLVTGLGGDEMVALSPTESAVVATANDHITDKLPWLGPFARSALVFSEDGIAPPAAVNAITLLSLETTAPPLLRAGIWPIHPFTHPGMINLGEQLPLDWREFKNLQRRQLASLGLSQDVCNPVERESFVWLVEHSLKTYGIPILENALADGSPLFDAGLVDPDVLKSTISEIEHQPYDEEFHAKLLQVIDLHLAATAFL
ncbi:asparagine synthase-related protein [Actinomadura syzygii]|uniref:Asparagine synthase n=1 Tax=Actinomadura syzygii TaxID=1427538 RepID=A0A5D0TR73_9ACTN|nr:asparagine synthase-related protein [Actinomadura syzygii]TYC08638.1 asparagine synthase [Actinomadura syzygii]